MIHYQEKLSAISDGSYDGNFRNRFFGKSKTDVDNLGFKIPTEEEIENAIHSIKNLHDGLFEIGSLTEPGKR